MLLGAYKVDWTESERGWGQKPDGTSIHLTKGEAEKFIKEQQPKMNYEDSYSYSYPHEIEFVPINEEISNKLQEEKSYWITCTSWWEGI